ncbi:MAG: glycosyltransferase family 39 protein [Acidobacteriota bacterium]|nr:glycosyltransferase family 39 protein [Acidobacteriota bacterium]
MRIINKLLKKYRWLDARVIAIVLTIKFLILLFAVQSYQIVNDQPVNDLTTVFSIWNRWDAQSYLSIAHYGYAAGGEDRFQLVFFPFYPSLIAFLTLFTQSYLASAFLVSGIASVALGLSFRELVRLDFSEKTAQLAVLFLFIFPTSFFLHIPYTESTFLALAVGCFLAARKRKWLWAGVLGGLACLTRVNGLILCAAILFEVWSERRETGKFNPAWLFLILIPAGFAVYLGLNHGLTGNPLMFLELQREHWGRRLTLPWSGFKGAYEMLFYKSPSGLQMHGVQELLFVAVGLLATVFGWRSLRASYRVWMVLNWLLFVSTSFIQSVPRYTLTLFPLFILMALAARRSYWAKVFLMVWSLLFLSLFATQFTRGWWAF